MPILEDWILPWPSNCSGESIERYWLGEAYYGSKDFKRAIDAYDKVELDYPRSEKVPAAILKKGYAYLALKDKKRASSAFKQVVTLYPRSHGNWKSI